MNLPNIYLIGFMGSGKSHWGRIWAGKNQLTFLDLDSEIEKEFGMKVVDIFEKHGEDKFRELEKEHLRKTGERKGLLVSCGGGTPCFFENMEWMKQNGTVVYLKASEHYLLDRVMEETAERPLLKEVNAAELLFFIQKKLKERAPVYEEADLILDAESLEEKSLEEIFKTA
ncbi:MAG: shikimate kinase [Chitinophagaceae bacterium]|nr:shikimate kinase [Chitinophagaceae bacterium]